MTRHDQDLQPQPGAAARPEGDSHDRYLDVTAGRAGPRPGTAGHRHPRVAAAAEQLPPDPGTAPIPEGHIRLWHYTPLEKVPSIREHGLLREMARGDAGNGDLTDPSAGVWASTKRPDDILENHASGTAVVEYHAHPSEISQNAEHFWHQDPQQWAHGWHHVIMRGDVPPHRITAIHEPWHSAARYMRDDDPTLQRYQWVKDQADPVYAPYRRGLQALERSAAAANAAASRNEARLAGWAAARQARADFPGPVQTPLSSRARGGRPSSPGRPQRHLPHEQSGGRGRRLREGHATDKAARAAAAAGGTGR